MAKTKQLHRNTSYSLLVHCGGRLLISACFVALGPGHNYSHWDLFTSVYQSIQEANVRPSVTLLKQLKTLKRSTANLHCNTWKKYILYKSESPKSSTNWSNAKTNGPQFSYKDKQNVSGIRTYSIRVVAALHFNQVIWLLKLSIFYHPKKTYN